MARTGMRIDRLIQLALDLVEGHEPEAALMVACIAVEGTGRKAFGDEADARVRFTQVIRDGASVFGPMAAPGVDLPDIADVLYAVHRYTHGHPDDLPDGFELLPAGEPFPSLTEPATPPGKARLTQSTITALLALAVLHPVNKKGAKLPAAYHLDFGAEEYAINDWWGRFDDFRAQVIELEA